MGPHIAGCRFISEVRQSIAKEFFLPRKLPQVHQGTLCRILRRLRRAIPFVPELGADVLAVDEDVGAPGRATALRDVSADIALNRGQRGLTSLIRDEPPLRVADTVLAAVGCRALA